MNDLDLNKAVAVKLGFTGVVLSLYGPPSVRAIASDESMLRSFDFCNNWQDALRSIRLVSSSVLLMLITGGEQLHMMGRAI